MHFQGKPLVSINISNPQDDTIRSQHATEVHGLHAEHINITSANLIIIVWQQLEPFLEKIIGHD